jgi:hypothetical protein
MKIASSSIAMSGTHSYQSYEYRESMTITARKDSGVWEGINAIRDTAGNDSVLEDMQQYSKEKAEKEAAEKQEKEKQSYQNYMDQLRKSQKSSGSQLDFSPDEEAKIKMLRKMLAMLNGKGNLDKEQLKSLKKNNLLDLRSSNLKMADSYNLAGQSSTGASVSVGTTISGTVWQKVTATSGFYSEAEQTTFQSTGLVTTADGRNISFGVEVSMSRAFTAKYDTLTCEEYVKTDPLMINLDTNVGSVSDMKFLFDLNEDGTEEEISFAGKGSGFLALDKNGDGKINDGSELFGTKSGDGFADLAAYDEDGNGWIDENDSIFSKLKVWTKDENGNDSLVDLKAADVGAIYLGNADTEFSLKDASQHTNGIIQKTGIYLKESTGAVGTVNHVDLTL